MCSSVRQHRYQPLRIKHLRWCQRPGKLGPHGPGGIQLG